jgi:uncharacterized protein (DUF58 family)
MLSCERGTVAAVLSGSRWGLVAAGAVALAGFAAGCGSDQGKFANRPRPPEPITVTAAIDHDRVRVSPATFGAGGITVLVSNQSGAAQELTFETDEIGGPPDAIRKSVGPVADGDTAQLQVNPPRRGTYRLSVKDPAIRPATITVGPRRPSSQNDLLTP